MEKLCNGKDKCNFNEEITCTVLVDKLESWHQKLGVSGSNSKAVVREEVKNLLEKIKRKEVKNIETNFNR